MTLTQTPTEQTAERQGSNRTGSAWAVVARREIVVKLTDRSFVVGSVMMLAMIIGLIGLQAWLDGRTQTYDVAVSSAAATDMVEAMSERAPEIDDGVAIDPVAEDSDDAARTAVEEETADAWLYTEADGTWTLLTRESADLGLRRVVEDVVRTAVLAENAEAVGTTVDDLTAGSTVELEQLDGDAELSTLRNILGFAMAFLFYFASIVFGMTLAQSVTEEKQSRIVEMIAAAVPLRQLLAGKVIGNTVLAVGQMAVYVAVGLVGLSFTDYGTMISAVTADVLWFLVFFLVGFLALACLWAVAGALASRNEDLQSTSSPVSMILLAVFLGSAFLDGRWEVIGSYIPPLSAVAMPVRLVDGTAAWWEAVISLGLLIALAGVLVLVAERLYRRALMQTGGKLSMRQAWKLEE